MRWIERVSGLLAGLLAIVAGLLAFQLPAVQTFGATTIYGGVSASLHSAIILPVALIVVAGIATAAVALFDMRLPTPNRVLAALSLMATALCAIGVGVLLAGNIDLVYAPSPTSSGLFLQYNAGALFTPTLIATFVCALTVIWPRRPAPPATAAPASR